MFLSIGFNLFTAKDSHPQQTCYAFLNSFPIRENVCVKNLINVKVRVKLQLSLHTLWWHIGGVTFLLALGGRWKWVVSFTYRPPYCRGKSVHYPLHRMLCEPHSRFEHVAEEINCSPLLGFEHRVAHPMDYDIPVTILWPFPPTLFEILVFTFTVAPCISMIHSLLVTNKCTKFT
jgi:hypothetical protein